MAIHFDFDLICVLRTEQFSEATLLYNYTAVHALPVATNLLTNAWLHITNMSADIHAYVWPWPEPEMFDNRKHVEATMMMLTIGLALVFVVPTFGSEIVRDRKVRCVCSYDGSETTI